MACYACRDCSAAFHLAPYQGKYPAPNPTPDPLEMQKLLAGMADRGADVAVVECESNGLAEGRWAIISLHASPCRVHLRSSAGQYMNQLSDGASDCSASGWKGHASCRVMVHLTLILPDPLCVRHALCRL